MYNNYLSEYDITLKNYFQDIRKYKPVLTKEEEIKLIKKVKFKHDSKAAEKLIVSNLRFVVTIAKTFQGQGLPLKDLIEEGNIGLIKACDKFSLNQNVRFITCAVWWIKQSIREAINLHKTTIRETLNNISDNNQMNKERDKFFAINGRFPYNGETLSNGKRYKEPNNISVSSLNSQLGSFDDIEAIDNVTGNDYEELELKTNNIYNNDTKLDVNYLLDCLNAQEKDVIKNVFGLNDTNSEIDLTTMAERYKVSVERIRQVQKLAFRKMRDLAVSNRMVINV